MKHSEHLRRIVCPALNQKLYMLHVALTSRGPPFAVAYEFPEGQDTCYLRLLVPKSIKGIVFGTRIIKYSVVGPSGLLGACKASLDPGCCLRYPMLLPCVQRLHATTRAFGQVRVWVLFLRACHSVPRSCHNVPRRTARVLDCV